MCCSCTNSVVIAIASQTVWEGWTACSRRVRGSWVMDLLYNLSTEAQAKNNVSLSENKEKLHYSDIWFCRKSTLVCVNITLHILTNFDLSSDPTVRVGIDSLNSVATREKNTGCCLQCEFLYEWCSIKCRWSSRWGYPSHVHACWSNSANSLLFILQYTAG